MSELVALRGGRSVTRVLEPRAEDASARLALAADLSLLGGSATAQRDALLAALGEALDLAGVALVARVAAIAAHDLGIVDIEGGEVRLRERLSGGGR